MKKQYKYLLNESDIPKQWYNIVPDLPNPLPPQLNPQTMEPIGPEDLAPLFPMGLILQEVSDQNYIDIPEPVLELYKIYRPSPMYLSLIHISEPTRPLYISYAVFCLKKKSRSHVDRQGTS